jgi:hypothetical protein
VEYSAVGLFMTLRPAVRAPGGICDKNSRTAPPRRQGCTTHDMQQPAGRWNREGEEGGGGGVLTASDISVCVGKERGRGLGLEVCGLSRAFRWPDLGGYIVQDFYCSEVFYKQTTS